MFCSAGIPVEGTAAVRPAGLFALDGASTLDITPRCAEWGEVERADILDFAVAPTGDWLAWTESGRLLRRRAGLWQSLDGVDGYPLLEPLPGGRGKVDPGRSPAATSDCSALPTCFHYRDAAP